MKIENVSAALKKVTKSDKEIQVVLTLVGEHRTRDAANLMEMTPGLVTVTVELAQMRLPSDDGDGEPGEGQTTLLDDGRIVDKETGQILAEVVIEPAGEDEEVPFDEPTTEGEAFSMEPAPEPEDAPAEASPHGKFTDGNFRDCGIYVGEVKVLADRAAEGSPALRTVNGIRLVVSRPDKEHVALDMQDARGAVMSEKFARSLARVFERALQVDSPTALVTAEEQTSTGWAYSATL